MNTFYEYKKNVGTEWRYKVNIIVIQMQKKREKLMRNAAAKSFIRVHLSVETLHPGTLLQLQKQQQQRRKKRQL